MQRHLTASCHSTRDRNTAVVILPLLGGGGSTGTDAAARNPVWKEGLTVLDDKTCIASTGNIKQTDSVKMGRSFEFMQRTEYSTP